MCWTRHWSYPFWRDLLDFVNLQRCDSHGSYHWFSTLEDHAGWIEKEGLSLAVFKETERHICLQWRRVLYRQSLVVLWVTSFFVPETSTAQKCSKAMKYIIIITHLQSQSIPNYNYWLLQRHCFNANCASYYYIRLHNVNQKDAFTKSK